MGLTTEDIKKISGLSTAEVSQRIKTEGYNELPSTQKRGIFAIALEIIKEPMFLLLLACGSLYFILGDIQEACMLLGFVFIIMGITFVQEKKTENALEALRDLSSPRALVIRDGQQKRIAGREVVRGDYLMLAEGDRIPADAIMIYENHISVDESLLTGESVPVRKSAGESGSVMGAPGGDDTPYIFSGTLVVQGQGIALVKAIGLQTEFGKIGKALKSIETENTLLQKETGRLVKVIAVIGVILCLTVIVAYGVLRGDWIQGILAGISLAMAMLPEEFPVVLTIFMALGAWRIAQKQVLTRRVPTIETLGSATVLCVDKTGTLTQNKMTITKLYANGEVTEITKNELTENFHSLMEYSILASQHDPFDPMEQAIRNLGVSMLARTEHIHENWTFIKEYPLSRELLAMSRVWQSVKHSSEYVIATKGSPEAICDLCHCTAVEQKTIQIEIEALAKQGLRVLGVARAVFEKTELPSIQHDFKFEFLGLIGLTDPVRPTVPAAIKECHQAGIRVVMITGDYPATAQNIAKQINMGSPHIITGLELNELSEAELLKRIKNVNIFARVVPEQKLRIVNAFKKAGEVVAMTGDGVNDAPALKAAHIGIAMGARGTDVAREASALVLLDDDFSSIVAAVRMGRRIYDNLRKAMSYILAIHIPIAGLSLFPIFFNLPLILMPVHIVFMELIIDPACTLVFEAENEEKDTMTRPPRLINEPLFNLKNLLLSLMQGFVVLALMLTLYLITLNFYTIAQAQTITFCALIIANLGLIFTNRSWTRTIVGLQSSKNKMATLVVSGTLLCLLLILYLPVLQRLFHFTTLGLKELSIAIFAGATSILWFEMFKMLKNYFNK